MESKGACRTMGSQPKALTPAMFQILVALAHGPSHGYGIMLELGGMDVKLGPGTLYRSIKQLLEAGLIAETETDDERRRLYELTDAGAELAAAEAQRLDALIGKARRAGLLTHPSLGTSR
jgi:DNA-binding PadR family transcriptional regulator